MKQARIAAAKAAAGLGGWSLDLHDFPDIGFCTVRPLDLVKTIEKAIAEDPDAAPILDEEWFKNAEIVFPPGKSALSLRIDNDVLGWFKRQGRGYQTKINAVLRAYVRAHKR